MDLNSVPGTVSVWLGPPGGTAHFARDADHPHYAASMMKVAVLAALHDSGLPLDMPVGVHNDFASAISGHRFGCERRHDADDEVWQLLGREATLGWLAQRMITRSSNLATNLLLERIGIGAADQVWRRLGARHSSVTRAIGDTAAAEAGLTNLVTAAELALLLSRIDTTALLGQEHREDLAAGLPPGTRVALKNGWVMGVRHAAGVVYPRDAPPFVLAVCTTTPWAINRPGDKACQLVSKISQEAWARRHDIGV